MFDTYQSSSVDLLLETPEQVSTALKDESILEDIKQEDALDTFTDYEFINIIRSDVFSLRETADEDKEEIAEQLPYAPLKQRFLSWLLRSLGWRYFHSVSVGEYLQDIEKDDSARIVSDKDELIDAESVTGKVKSDVAIEELLTIEKEGKDNILRLARRYFVTDLSHKIRKMFMRSNSTIGFDIGSEYVKFTQIRKDKSKYILDRYNIQEIGNKPDDSPEVFRSKVALAIQKILPHDILPVSDISVSISKLPVFMKSEKLPSMEKKELHQAIMFRAQKFTPETIKDPEILYEIIEKSESKDESTVFVRIYIIDKTELSEWKNVLRDCGIVPEKITLPHMSVQQNIRHFFPLSTGMVVFDFGGSQSQLIFFDKGTIKLVRDIDLGVDNFIRSLVGVAHFKDESIEIDYGMAEKLLKLYGISDKNSIGNTEYKLPISRIGIMLYEIVGKIILEIQRSIDFYKSNFPGATVETMLVTGGGSEIINLFDVLESQLEIPVRQFSYLKNLTIGRDITELDHLLRDAYMLTGSVGLALDDTDDLNLLSSKDQSRKKNNLMTLGMSVIVLISALVISTVTMGIRSEFDEVFARTRNAEQSLSEKMPTRNEYFSLIDQVSNASNLKNFIFEQLMLNSEDDSIENILKLLSNHRYSQEIRINSIKIYESRMENVLVNNMYEAKLSPRSIVIKGESVAENSNSSILNYIFYLQELPYFERIEKQPFEGAEFDNKRFFQLSLVLRGYIENDTK